MNYKSNGLMKVLVLFIFLMSVSLFTACLDIGEIDIFLKLEKDDLYAGRGRLEFINIHSTSKTATEQKKEMDKFFSDYNQDVENIIRAMPLYNHTAEFRNRKELSSDVVINGEFKNVMAVIGSLMSEGNFHFEGNRKRLSVYWENPLTDATKVNLIIEYPGRIVKHNSKNFDSKNGIMKWNMSKTGDKEISFVLESD